jgi:alpha-L-fucosidase
VLRSILLFTLVISACAQPAAVPGGAPKFGIAIHWGLYSIPAGQWKGQPIAGPGEDIMREARIPVTEYEKLAAQFNPVKFNADTWAKWAQESGVQLMVASAKGPDGFAMYRSESNKYNVFDATPFHRDPLKELQLASAKRNIKLGVSYSLARDWHEPNGVASPNLESQVKELLRGYGPLSAFSFGPRDSIDSAVSKRFLDMVSAAQPSAFAFFNLAPQVTIQNINQTAGFKQFDNSWKSIDELIFNLVDTASTGGTYILNVGPTAEGIIPQPVLVLVQQIGDWLKVNGDAIYGAGQAARSISVSNVTKWRVTTKPGKFFLITFQWPSGPLQIDGVQDKVTKAYLLSDVPRTPLPLSQIGGHVEVTLPKDPSLPPDIPDRVNPRLMIAALHAHVRSVVVLETQSNIH